MTKEEIENQLISIQNDKWSIVFFEGYCSTIASYFGTVSQYLSNCSTYLEKGLKIDGKTADDGAIDLKVEELNKKILTMRTIIQHIVMIKGYLNNLESSLRTQLAGVKDGTK